jgi:hypothetical protein
LVQQASQNAQPKELQGWREIFSYSPQEVFPIEVGTYGYPFIQARIRDLDLALAIDTGNMQGILISPKIAGKLKLETSGGIRRLDSAGNPVGTFKQFQIDQIQMLGKSWRNQSAMENNNTRLNGLIGPKYLGSRFSLDYRLRVLAVSDSAIDPENISVQPLEMVRSERNPLLIIVRGQVGKRPVLIELDTGKSRSTLDPSLAAELGLPQTLGGYRLEDLRLGGLSFAVANAKAVDFSGISGDLEEPILVGAGSDILSKVVLTVDYRLRRVWLIRQPDPPPAKSSQQQD